MTRLHAVRLRNGEHIKEAIEKLVAEQAFSSATIVSAVGSLRLVTMRMAGAKPDMQDIRTLQGPFEIVSLIGTISADRVHLHIAVSDSEGKVIGGHLKEGSVVETTVELVIAEENTLRFGGELDEETGFDELKVEEVS